MNDEETKVPEAGQLRGHAVVSTKRLAHLGLSIAKEIAAAAEQPWRCCRCGLESTGSHDDIDCEWQRLKKALAPIRAELAEMRRRVAALEGGGDDGK